MTTMELNKIYTGKMEVVLNDCPDCFFDSCVTDPPYGLKFMGKKWDYDVPKVEQFKEIFRVLKHGAHILVACGTRTQHRMACNIEDAGFEIRDVITWHYGSGFPKSMNISKQIDKQAGAERELVGKNKAGSTSKAFHLRDQYDGTDLFLTAGEYDVTAPSTDEAKQWNGWGTALKPATEFWTLARKPLSENTVAENVLKHGTGGINIDGSRIELQEQDDKDLRVINRNIREGDDGWGMQDNKSDIVQVLKEQGRFPANVIFDEFTGKILDEQAPNSGAFAPVKSGQNGQSQGIYGDFNQKGDDGQSFYNDFGGASRFFYCPKADNYERNKGLEKFDEKLQANANFRPNHLEKALQGDSGKPHGRYTPKRNNHPTVKPIDLMRYLVKLITPKNGIVLDPFCGSGTTCIGAKLELMKWVGIEMDEEYAKISEARIAAWNPAKYLSQTLF